MLSWYPVLGIVQSVLQFNPWQKCSFKIHLNFSGKQLFWYPNCIDTCIFVCREYVIILFKAIFSKHLRTKTNSTPVGVHSVFCSKCTCEFNVEKIGPLLTYDSHAHTHARTRGLGGDGSRQGGWQEDRQAKYVRCLQSFVLFKVFYTSPPSTPVHSNSFSTSLGSTQPCCSYCTKTIRTYIHRPYSQVLIDINE